MVAKVALVVVVHGILGHNGGGDYCGVNGDGVSDGTDNGDNGGNGGGNDSVAW